MLLFKDLEPKNIKVGSIQVVSIYLNNNQIWPTYTRILANSASLPFRCTDGLILTVLK